LTGIERRLSSEVEDLLHALVESRGRIRERVDEISHLGLPAVIDRTGGEI
jgi:hypothetical protein